MTTAATIAALPKTSRGEKGLKAAIKTKNMRKTEKGKTTAAQGTVTTKKGKDGPAVAKSENRIPTKTQTRGQIQKRGGKTGKQPGRTAQTILLLTEITQTWTRTTQVTNRKTAADPFVPGN